MLLTRGWLCCCGFIFGWWQMATRKGIVVDVASAVIGVGWSWSLSPLNMNESNSTPSTFRSSTISLTSSLATQLAEPSTATGEVDMAVTLSAATSRQVDQSKSKEGEDKRSDVTGDCKVSDGNGGGGGDDVEDEFDGKTERLAESSVVSSVKLILLTALFVTSATTTPPRLPLESIIWSSKEGKQGIAIFSCCNIVPKVSGLKSSVNALFIGNSGGGFGGKQETGIGTRIALSGIFLTRAISLWSVHVNWQKDRKGQCSSGRVGTRPRPFVIKCNKDKLVRRSDLFFFVHNNHDVWTTASLLNFGIVIHILVLSDLCHYFTESIDSCKPSTKSHLMINSWVGLDHRC